MQLHNIIGYELFEARRALPEVWYHGTSTDFDRFDGSKMGTNFESSTLGTYFTDRIYPPPYSATASEYAKNAASKHGGEPVVYEVHLDMKNPLVIDSNGWYSSNACIDKQRADIARWMRDGGHDAVVAYDFAAKDDYVAAVKDPDSIKIIKKHNI